MLVRSIPEPKRSIVQRKSAISVDRTKSRSIYENQSLQHQDVHQLTVFNQVALVRLASTVANGS